MAKVHKAHKSTKKYGFQKKKISVKTLLIVLAVVVVAAIGLKIAYDKHLYGEFEVAAPTSEQLSNIADNWEVLNTYDEFYNYYDEYYAMLGYENDGTDGYGNIVLIYTGHEDIEEISIQIATEGVAGDVTTYGGFARTTLTDFINGVAPWNQTAKQVSANNGKCAVVVYDEATENLDDDILAEVIAEIEAFIAQGPAVVEETPAEETTEEVPAE